MKGELDVSSTYEIIIAEIYGGPIYFTFIGKYGVLCQLSSDVRAFSINRTISDSKYFFLVYDGIDWKHCTDFYSSITTYRSVFLNYLLYESYV